MGIFSKVDVDKDFDTPGQLAQELDSHKQRYETGRQNILDRGTAKVTQLENLIVEAAAEKKAHEQILQDLKAAA